MKRLYTAVLSGSLVLFCLHAWAGHHHGRYDTAKVIRTSPIFLTVRVPGFMPPTTPITTVDARRRFTTVVFCSRKNPQKPLLWVALS